jgi:hypothetical protein
MQINNRIKKHISESTYFIFSRFPSGQKKKMTPHSITRDVLKGE